MEKRRKRLLLDVEPDFHDTVKLAAGAAGVPIKELIVEALEKRFEMPDVKAPVAAFRAAKSVKSA